MRAITVQQPWATAIIRWGKSPENRSRNIAGAYRGPLAIHAGKTEDECGYGDEMIRQATAKYDDGWLLEEHLEPRGAIIGVVNLWAVHQARSGCCPDRGGKPFGSWWAQPDSWHLCVSDPRPLEVPIPCRGALGLWTVRCVHCNDEVRITERDDWIHESNLYRCQSPTVAYGHLAHPSGVPCRADGPNPCLGAVVA